MFLGQCQHISPSELLCDSPVIDADSAQLSADAPAQLEYGFFMDHVTSVQNLTQQKFPVADKAETSADTSSGFSFKNFDDKMASEKSEKSFHATAALRPFELYPNPVYLPFEENVKYYKSEYLTINGKHLDRACKESDVTVKIGDGICNITSLSRQQLTCRPPSDTQQTKQEAAEVSETLDYKKIQKTVEFEFFYGFFNLVSVFFWNANIFWLLKVF